MGSLNIYHIEKRTFVLDLKQMFVYETNGIALSDYMHIFFIRKGIRCAAVGV